WMGGALLLLQGAIVLCWLLARFGRQGALVAALLFLLAWGVEHVGVLSGFPFGRYRYTTLLQPQLLGVVPLAIPCAWLMVVIGAYQFGFWFVDGRSTYSFQSQHPKSKIQNWIATATLVLLLDMQIETVATEVNRYWIWLDRGRYYGVPAANFVAWWLVGLALAVVVSIGLNNKYQASRPVASALHIGERAMFRAIPMSLYLLSTLMFVTINFARGYQLAGSLGLLVLLVAVWLAWPALVRRASAPPAAALHSLHDAPDA
ncbi:MAG TPA: carotenoid biosynthesis protein, partial [Roseiflexaceae bacterium]|nr:carotenoid biosynthesis protein [Roseiflexaceae bacterium]